MASHGNKRKQSCVRKPTEAELIRSYVRDYAPNDVDEQDLEAVSSMLLAIQIPYGELRDQGKTVFRKATQYAHIDALRKQGQTVTEHINALSGCKMVTRKERNDKDKRFITNYSVDCPLIFRFSCQQLQAGSKRRITSLYLNIMCAFDQDGTRLPKVGYRGHYLKHVAKLGHLQELVLRTWEPGLSLTKIIWMFPNLTSLNFEFGLDRFEPLVIGSPDLLQRVQSKLEKLRVLSPNGKCKHVSEILLEVLPFLPNLWSLNFKGHGLARFWDIAKTVQDNTSKIDPNSRLRAVKIGGIHAHYTENRFLNEFLPESTELFADSTQASLKSMVRAFRKLETFDVYGLPIGKMNRVLECMLDHRRLDSATLPSVLWPLVLARAGRAKRGAKVEPNGTYYLLQNIQQLQHLTKLQG